MPPAKRAKVTGCGERPPPAVTIEIDPKDDDDESYDDDDDDPLGHRGDYECTRHFGAKILVNGAPAGSLSAVLVNRSMAGSVLPQRVRRGERRAPGDRLPLLWQQWPAPLHRSQERRRPRPRRRRFRLPARELARGATQPR